MGFEKKRKRAEGQSKRSKAPNTNAKRQKTNATKRVTSVDALTWKSVDVPEMFDDAEGFYGLEEVEGVDIVREGNTVKFVSISMRHAWPVPMLTASPRSPLLLVVPMRVMSSMGSMTPRRQMGLSLIARLHPQYLSLGRRSLKFEIRMLKPRRRRKLQRATSPRPTPN